MRLKPEEVPVGAQQVIDKRAGQLVALVGRVKYDLRALVALAYLTGLTDGFDAVLHDEQRVKRAEQDKELL